MQQQQTSQWSSGTYLTISNNSKNLKHPPISYPSNSTIQHFNGTNRDVQNELQTREFQWAKYYTQMNLAVFNPSIWSEYVSVLFRILTGQNIVHQQKSSLRVCVASVVSSRYSSKWINWRIPKRPWDSGFDRHIFTTRKNTPLKPISYRFTTTTRLNKRKGTIQAPLHFRWCLVFQ